MNNTVDQFADYLANEKKARANTVDSYLRDVSAFLTQCGADFSNASAPGMPGIEAVQRYLDNMLESGRSQASVRRAWASLKCFFDFASKGDEHACGRLGQIIVGPCKKKAPEVLSLTELERLLSAPDSACPTGLRNKCMLGLLYAAGLKVSELVALDVSDVRMLKGYVRCKNDKGCRFIPINAAASRLLDEYLEPRGGIGGALFLNARGERMTRQGFWKILKQCAARAKIEKGITPQTLRYTLALHLYQNGADKRDIQSMLGYADISSLQLCIGGPHGGSREQYSAQRAYAAKSGRKRGEKI